MSRSLAVTGHPHQRPSCEPVISCLSRKSSTGLSITSSISEHPYDDCPHGGFRSVDGCRYWIANGESITGDQFDLVEFESNAAAGAVVPSTQPPASTALDFVREFVEAWDEGMAGDSSLIVNAPTTWRKQRAEVGASEAPAWSLIPQPVRSRAVCSRFRPVGYCA